MKGHITNIKTVSLPCLNISKSLSRGVSVSVSVFLVYQRKRQRGGVLEKGEKQRGDMLERWESQREIC